MNGNTGRLEMTIAVVSLDGVNGVAKQLKRMELWKFPVLGAFLPAQIDSMGARARGRIFCCFTMLTRPLLTVLPTFIASAALVAGYAACAGAIMEENPWGLSAGITTEAVDAWGYDRQGEYANAHAGYCPARTGQNLDGRGSLARTNKHTVGLQLASEDARVIRSACQLPGAGCIAPDLLAEIDAPFGRFKNGEMDALVCASIVAALGTPSSVDRLQLIRHQLLALESPRFLRARDIGWRADSVRGGGGNLPPMRDFAGPPPEDQDNSSVRSRAICPSNRLRREATGAQRASARRKHPVQRSK